MSRSIGFPPAPEYGETGWYEWYVASQYDYRADEAEVEAAQARHVADLALAAFYAVVPRIT